MDALDEYDDTCGDGDDGGVGDEEIDEEEAGEGGDKGGEMVESDEDSSGGGVNSGDGGDNGAYEGDGDRDGGAGEWWEERMDRLEGAAQFLWA